MSEPKENHPFELALTSGLSPGAKLRENRMLQFSATGIKFNGDLTLEQWREVLGLWKQVRGTYFTGLADIIAYGKTKFGEEIVKDALVQYEFDLADEARALAIGQLPLELRSLSLTEEHYFVLGKKLDDDKERRKWITLVEKHELSAYELEKSIEAGKIVKGATLSDRQGRNSGLLTIQSIAARFDTWEKNVGGEEKILLMDEENKRALFKELEKPGELYLKLKAQLGG